MRVYARHNWISYGDEDGNEIGKCLPARYHKLKLTFNDDPYEPPGWSAVCPMSPNGCVQLHDEEQEPPEKCWVETWVVSGNAIGGGMSVTFTAEWEFGGDYLAGWVTGLHGLDIKE